ncbi:MAG: hypothetical protein ACMZ7B_08495 [Balneola sp.]
MRELVFSTILTFCGVSLSCSDNMIEHYITDESFILLEDSVSPNNKFRYLVYQYDTGVFGYSRVFWSVIDSTDSTVNLAEYKIPDGYKIAGWSSNNEIELEKWDPYYYKDEEIEYSSGDTFKGITIKIVSN